MRILILLDATSSPSRYIQTRTMLQRAKKPLRRSVVLIVFSEMRKNEKFMMNKELYV